MRHRHAHLATGGVGVHGEAAHLVTNRHHGIVPDKGQGSPWLDGAARLKSTLKLASKSCGKIAVALDSAVGAGDETEAVVAWRPPLQQQ